MSIDAAELTALKQGLLDGVRDELIGTSGGVPNRVCRVPGFDIAWDDCECGQLTVHHRTIVPSKRFPQPIVDESLKCSPPMWAVDVVITVLRCLPDTDDASPPPCVELGEVAARVDEDIAATLRGVHCTLAGTDVLHLVSNITSLGGEGLCTGFELTVVVSLPNCRVVC